MNKKERQVFYAEHLKGLEFFANVIKSNQYDVVIADELIDVVTNKIVTDHQLATILKTKAKTVEVLLSGHMLPLECAKTADLISEVKLIKHYFDKKIPARKGIEF